MRDSSESGHGRKRNKKVMCCIATGAAPGSSQRLSLALLVLQDRTQLPPRRAQAGPRHPVCIGTLWKFALWLPLKALCSDLVEQLPSESFAYMEKLFEEFIDSVKRKLVGAMLHIFSTRWKFQSIKLIVITRTSLFRPYRIHIKILLPTNFGIC